MPPNVEQNSMYVGETVVPMFPYSRSLPQNCVSQEQIQTSFSNTSCEFWKKIRDKNTVLAWKKEETQKLTGE